jgi:ribosome biogenesis ATPase
MDLNKSLTVAYAKAVVQGVSKRQRPQEENQDSVDPTKANTANVNADTELMTPTMFEASLKKKFRKKGDIPSKLISSDDMNEPPSSASKRVGFLVPRPNNRLAHLAGIDSIVSQVREMVFYPVQYASMYKYLGVKPPCGVLLHGPSGCGKTSLANAIAGELNLPYFKASGPELIGGTTGESEERVREIFQSAIDAAPSVLFIDALDVIAGKKEVGRSILFALVIKCELMMRIVNSTRHGSPDHRSTLRQH